MQIPEYAAVKPYTSAAPRSLVVGRMEDVNFFAIRTELSNTGSDEPSLTILNPSVQDRTVPFLFQPIPVTVVLDLGTDWSVDVPIDRDAPYLNRAIKQDSDAILVRCGLKYFLDLGSNEGFVDLATGFWEADLPDRSKLASWNRFSICLKQDNLPGPGPEVYTWPEEF